MTARCDAAAETSPSRFPNRVNPSNSNTHTQSATDAETQRNVAPHVVRIPRQPFPTAHQGFSRCRSTTPSRKTLEFNRMPAHHTRCKTATLSRRLNICTLRNPQKPSGKRCLNRLRRHRGCHPRIHRQHHSHVLMLQRMTVKHKRTTERTEVQQQSPDQSTAC